MFTDQTIPKVTAVKRYFLQTIILPVATKGSENIKHQEYLILTLFSQSHCTGSEEGMKNIAENFRNVVVAWG